MIYYRTSMTEKPSMPQKTAAELLGTFALVFAGTAAITVNDLSGGAVTHVGVSMTFGLVVAAMIYSLGGISGAHLNPAVTIGFWLSRRMALRRVPAYIAGQSAGAILASLAVKTLFPEHQTIGATIPAGAYSQSFMLELIMTFILMFVILNVSTGEKEKGTMAGAAIGSVVAFEALLGGPVSGASMNPARSFGPALISWHVQGLWIYFIAPLSGATLAVIACKYLHRGTGACCGGAYELGNTDG